MTPPIPAGAKMHRDLLYVGGGGARQRLDLYLPPRAHDVPLIIWIHGGAWRMENKTQNVPLWLLDERYAVAAINYRLSPPMHEDGNARERREAQSGRDVFPAQIEDCKAAVRWLRANADEHGIDASRIAAWGESAVLGRGGGAALPNAARHI